MTMVRCESCDGEMSVCKIHGMQSACDCDDPNFEVCDECLGDGEVFEESDEDE